MVVTGTSDRETGLARIDKYAVSHDCGVVVYPMLVEGQIMRDTGQGVGGILCEAIVYDSNGQLLTGSPHAGMTRGEPAHAVSRFSNPRASPSDPLQSARASANSRILSVLIRFAFPDGTPG